MSDLHDAVDAAVALHPHDDEWTALTIATVRLASAAMAFNRARAACIAKHPVSAS